MQVGVREGCIRESIAEGEKRLDGAFVVGAVPDVNTLPRCLTVSQKLTV